MRAHLLSAGLLVLAAASAKASAAMPTCLPQIEVSQAKAVRVEKNGVVVLADGRAARLEGVLLPAGASDHGPRNFADQAIAALDDLVTDHVVTLAAAAPKEDRYGRIRAQILVHTNGSDVWLQEEMLRKGLGRVAMAPDRIECAEELYAVEAEARRQRIGLWSSRAYAIRTPSQAESDVGTFQIIEGTVDSISSTGGRVFLDFESEEGPALAATISTDDMKRFRQIGVDPYAYANNRVRVRGWIERGHRLPEIALATPEQVEIVQAPQ